eukprot:m.89447 g.89447  ORF g.89447 m.89447 type:complete len:722 (-) comp8830_c0_seq1:498-2663(-)
MRGKGRKRGKKPGKGDIDGGARGTRKDVVEKRGEYHIVQVSPDLSSADNNEELGGMIDDGVGQYVVCVTKEDGDKEGTPGNMETLVLVTYFLRPSQLSIVFEEDDKGEEDQFIFAPQEVIATQYTNKLPRSELQRQCCVLPVPLFKKRNVEKCDDAHTFVCTRQFDYKTRTLSPYTLSLYPIGKTSLRRIPRFFLESWSPKDVLYFQKGLHGYLPGYPIVIGGIVARYLSDDQVPLKSSSRGGMGLVDMIQKRDTVTISHSKKTRRKKKQDNAMSDQRAVSKHVTLTPKLQERLATMSENTNVIEEVEEEGGDVSVPATVSTTTSLPKSSSSLFVSSDSVKETAKRRQKGKRKKLADDVVNKKAKEMELVRDATVTKQLDLDMYFDEHHGQPSKTSSNTLSKLKLSAMNEKTIWEIVKAFHSQSSTAHEEKIDTIKKSLFPKFGRQLQANFNVAVYGVGSKKKLLAAFADEYLRSEYVITVNGFFPSLNLKQILTMISDNILEMHVPTRDSVDHARTIVHYYKQSKDLPNIYMLVHSLDGFKLRSPLAQEVLSILGSIPEIRIIASLDHINFPLLWSQTTLGRFNFVWHEANTFDMYEQETSYSDTLVLKSGQLRVAGVSHVMQAIPESARKCYWILLQHCLSHPVSKGLSFDVYLDRCMQQFAVHGEHALRTHLREFKDHHIVTTSLVNGVEMCRIDAELDTLKEVEAIIKENFEIDIDV